MSFRTAHASPAPAGLLRSSDRLAALATVLALAAAGACRREAGPAAPAPSARGGAEGSGSVPPAGGAPATPGGTREGPAAAPPGLAPPPPDLPAGRVLSVLYTSNLRGEYDSHPLGGLARRATYAAELRGDAAPGSALLQLDAGDSLLPRIAPAPGDPPPDPGEVDRRARLLAGGLARLGLAALTPGETDLAMGAAKLKALARKAKLPLVSANVVDPRGKPWFDTHRFIQLGDTRVGVFGILSLAPEEAPAAERAGYAVTDPVAAAQGLSATLREQGAEVVVGLYHLAGGLDEARRLAPQIAGVDVVVLGHGAEELAEPVKLVDSAEGATVAVSALERGKYLGHLDLHLVESDLGFLPPARAAAGSGGRSWYANRIVRLDDKLVSDERMLAYLRPYIAETRRRIARKLPVGLTAQPGSDGKLATATVERWTYSSSSGCLLCHLVQGDHFKGSVHAFAMLSLERKGRERDPYCLGCHSTAFDRPGGTRNLQTANTYFRDVGCESCHGPGVEHVRLQTKASIKLATPEAVCRECHRPEQSLEPFDYKRALGEVLGPGHGG